jgi:putative ABC transport system ATP-binding protein
MEANTNAHPAAHQALIIEAKSDIYSNGDVRASLDEDEEDLIIKMDNIHKTYLLGIEGVPALRGVSLGIKRGEFIVVYGLSGGGKTTLLNIIGTIDKPTKGEMKLSGTRINSNTTDKVLSYLRLHEIGFVFQTFNLLSSLTALENVEMPMILAGQLSAKERRQRAIELLERVGMGQRLDHLPSMLSGGEQQRVTIARAMANSPKLLLLDEPTGDLDTKNSAIVMKLLTDLNQKDKITLVMVTHDVGLKNFADRVIWMRDGKIMRLEVIPEDIREQRHEQLDKDLEKLLKGRTITKKRFGTHTILREPEDYETHPNHQKKDPVFFNFTTQQRDSDLRDITQDQYERMTNLIPANNNHTIIDLSGVDSPSNSTNPSPQNSLKGIEGCKLE